MMRLLKFLFSGLLLAYGLPLFADINQEQAKGFHWYSQEHPLAEEKLKEKPLLSKTQGKKLSPYEELLAQRRQTLDKLSTALLRPSFAATHEYMKAQMVYAKKNQAFVRHWQEVLLLHPELDSTLNFPTDNSAIALRNEATRKLSEEIIQKAAKKYGLILFYKGNSTVSQKFIGFIQPFVQQYSFAMISVSVDGKAISGLPNARFIPMSHLKKTLKLKSRYLPVLFLVDLKNQSMSPLSYGFVSITELKERFLDAITHFKRFSYQGLQDEDSLF